MISTRSDFDVDLVDHMGDDRGLADAAWVSTTEELQAAAKTQDDVVGTLGYLMKNRHGTPFEHGAVKLRVCAPIFVWREWHRHRVGFSYNEESGRYKPLKPVFYLPPRDRPTMKVDGWKPGKPKFADEDPEYHDFCRRKSINYETCYRSYVIDLERGVDPGLARVDLPVGVYSSCFVTANPRSLMHFLSLRVHVPTATFPSYPLWEMDQAAQQVEEIFQRSFPVTHHHFVSNGRVAP